MNEKEGKKEALRGMDEFDLAWNEFFKDKPEPKSDEEDKSQQEEFCHWYNYVRKQSDIGKTPAEMYKEVYGEDPKNIFDEKKPSRFMNFEWDEDYNEDDFDKEDKEQHLKEISELADIMFNESVWQNSKEEIKNMSRREASQHMFRLGFFLHSKYMREQMKDISDELKNMSKEDIEKLIDNFKKYEEEKKDE